MSGAGARLARSLAGPVRDERVLAAIAAVPRERFTPLAVSDQAYENIALPIGCEQTISQPLVVGRMLELLELRPSDRVLDVGTGSGYHAALLARLAAHVDSIERHPALAESAARVLRDLGMANVRVFVGDGTLGLPERAPFDAINVAAAITLEVPPALVGQLARGGRLVAPVAADGSRPNEQRLTVLRRHGDRITRTVFEPVRFVPLVAGEADPPG